MTDNTAGPTTASPPPSAPTARRAPRLPRPSPLVLKMIVIVLLTFVLMIPLGWVRGVITERASYSESVQRELGKTWGGPQRLAGPLLVVPFAWRESYRVRDQKADGEEPVYLVKQRDKEARLYILPAQQSLIADGKTQIRYRGPYKALLYGTEIQVEGSFTLPKVADLDLPEGAQLLWQRARFLVHVSDLASSTSISPLSWGGGSAPFDVATDRPTTHPWIAASLPTTASTGETRFSFTLGLNGSRGLTFIPFGQSSQARLAMDWPHPSFAGSQLPTESTIDESGFTAAWSQSHLARGLASVLRSDRAGQDALAARLDSPGLTAWLVDPIDTYHKAERAVKYGLLFIAVTFGTLVVFEALSLRAAAGGSAPTGDRSLHPVQYSLLGGALILFFLLFLSLAEVIGFAAAYWSAAGLVLALVTAYTAKATTSLLRGLQLGGGLAAVYGYLFVVLRAEDHALLMGSLLLFAMLALVMYATRNVDWSALGRSQSSDKR